MFLFYQTKTDNKKLELKLCVIPNYRGPVLLMMMINSLAEADPSFQVPQPSASKLLTVENIFGESNRETYTESNCLSGKIHITTPGLNLNLPI